MGKLYINKIKDKNNIASCLITNYKDFILKAVEVFDSYEDIKKVIYQDQFKKYELERV